MTIETRHQQRVRLTFDVHIIYRRRLFQAAASNLSSEGIFLTTGALTLPTGTLIDMEFKLGVRKWLIAGLVVRQNPSGIGIMFRNPQPTLFKLAGEIAAVQPPRLQPAAPIQPPMAVKRNTSPARAS